MLPVFLSSAEGAAGAGGGASMLTMFLPMLFLLGAMYFIMIRPQNKKEKALQSMRNSLEIGDNVVTIGGIVGRVVALKDDTVVLETGTERNKVRFKRWAVQEVEKLTLE